MGPTKQRCIHEEPGEPPGRPALAVGSVFMGSGFMGLHNKRKLCHPVQAVVQTLRALPACETTRNKRTQQNPQFNTNRTQPGKEQGHQPRDRRVSLQ